MLTRYKTVMQSSSSASFMSGPTLEESADKKRSRKASSETSRYLEQQSVAVLGTLAEVKQLGERGIWDGVVDKCEAMVRDPLFRSALFRVVPASDMYSLVAWRVRALCELHRHREASLVAEEASSVSSEEKAGRERHKVAPRVSTHWC